MNIIKYLVWPIVRTFWPVVLVVLIGYILYKWIQKGGPEALYWEIVVALDERKARREK